ncbi:cupin domain-containing protein [Pigmentiphaga sp. GD03639]|uniref:cupin domain-containing protein n=1 Tax=unclassified Pigmentiphaga TaxID=2626614 RepID=UPI00244A34E8|nr:cupin domain-containing protein [Pigmentiphaga sp. GD03639]MDH2235158.1 cupin domain-containing protein [Pigmentiphaga sp. GD03639]
MTQISGNQPAGARPSIRSHRRIVTGHDAQGRSIFLCDGLAPNVKQPDAVPNLAMIDLWETSCTPASNAGAADAADRPTPLSPPPGGSIFRILVLPPESERDFSKVADQFAHWGEGHVLTGKNRHPAFHKTNTIDYAIVLEGEVWALMDIGETLMKAGDVLIQRGTNHAWSNRSDSPVRIAFVLIDAQPL